MIERRGFLKSGVAATAGVFFSRQVLKGAEEGVVGTEFSLPELGFAFDALEPHIDAKTMEIHHGKHHAGYVRKLNDALAGREDMAGESIVNLLTRLPAMEDKDLMTAVRNNGGGHFNHMLFWESLAPEGKGGEVSGDLRAAVDGEFGSLDKMKEEFGKAAGSQFGSGWAWLVKKDGKLKVTNTPNQDAPIMVGVVPDDEVGVPLLGLDVWEHAYYLKYQNQRGEYVKAFWDVVNWDVVSRRFAA